ncbi:MAG: DUF5050 domain-containing protein [Chloroflexota bacterium]|nr:DUF5050 domain-containing protein [Chloroflexota bacterium]
MQAFTLYTTAAVLFVLGLMAIGGATFGRDKNRRILLAVLGLICWGLTLLLYGMAAAQPVVTETPTPAVAEVAATPTPLPAASPEAVVEPSEEVGQEKATPEPLPDFPGRIVFHSDRTGRLEIWAMNADGSDLQQLTDSPGRDLEPDWSPDGQTILFSSGRDDADNVQLYVMDADGSNQRRLMSLMPSDQLGARWSPNGEWLLFYSNMLVEGSPRFEVYKVRKDGSELENISNHPGNNLRPDWSPDGERILFFSERDGNPELYVMNADGSNQVRLTDNPADDKRPRWSPDGETILFESNRDGNKNLYVMDAPSVAVAGPMEESVRLLTFPAVNDEAANWAMDGDMIVMSSDRDSDVMVNWDIYLLSADGSEVYRLTNDGESDRYPDWTAD